MRKITKLLLTAALLVAGVGGANAIRLNATYNNPDPNGSWDTTTNTYTWIGNSYNLMTLFQFSNGELANYTSIHMTTSDLTGLAPYRICFMNGSDKMAQIDFYSVGQKDINFADRDETKNLDMSTITHISFGGYSNSGTIKLTNVYLEGPDPLYHEVYALGSPITFAQALTTTDPFVLVQNGKVLCGPLSATDNSLTFKDVTEIGDYSWAIKFEEDADHAGSYFMELCNSNGVSKGFINGSVWSHTYLSGVDKNGKKGEQQDGALWTIAEAGNGKYTIKNLGVTEGSYNDKPSGNEGDRAAAGQGYLGITPSGYWADHVTIYNTSGEWEFYTLSTTQLTANDPLFFGWDKLSFSNSSDVTVDNEKHLVVDNRGYAPYWAETASWKFDTPFDASGYRYLVFFAKRNISKYGNGDNETGGCLFIKDNSVTMRQDDYSKYSDVNYPNVPSGGFWMNKWGNTQRTTILDLQWLANNDKFGDSSECKALDISNIKEIGVAGSFTIGGIFFTNTMPAYSAGDYKRSFDSFDKFGTICLPYNAVCCGAQLYEISGKSSNAISLSEYEGIMEAGKPYFYKTLEAKKNSDLINETDVYFFKAGYEIVSAPVENNGLIGTFSQITAPQGANYLILSKNALYNTEDSNVTVGANKAYIDKTKILNVAAGRTMLFFDEGETTGVSNVVAAQHNDGQFYDMQGRVVARPSKGLYIMNGKKVIIK